LADKLAYVFDVEPLLGCGENKCILTEMPRKLTYNSIGLMQLMNHNHFFSEIEQLSALG
jgi:hypothetical protein